MIAALRGVSEPQTLNDENVRSQQGAMDLVLLIARSIDTQIVNPDHACPPRDQQISRFGSDVDMVVAERLAFGNLGVGCTEEYAEPGQIVRHVGRGDSRAGSVYDDGRSLETGERDLVECCAIADEMSRHIDVREQMSSHVVNLRD